VIAIRKSANRGHFDHGWLDTYHTFSFGDYHDPSQMGFRSLRVINEDRIAPSMGFGMHGHRDMEIITLVLSGALAHQDSLGHGEVLHPGELQHMSAGSGIRHSEFNPSAAEQTHLYQIWLLPREKGLPPDYHQKSFDPAERDAKWQLVASPDGIEGSLPIAQDAKIYLADVKSHEKIDFDLAAPRHAWLQVLRGAVNLNGQKLIEGDGAAATTEPRLSLQAITPSELMLFDLS